EAAGLAIFLLEARRAAEHAAEIADILAEDDDIVVPLHGDVHGGTDRLDHGHARHGADSVERAGIDTPLWPAGHLPLKGGDRPSSMLRPAAKVCAGWRSCQSPPLRGRWPVGQRGVPMAHSVILTP